LTAEADLEKPTDEELLLFDKNRKNKKLTNDDWQSPSDPDARITKIKDGTTHPAYKAEHVVDWIRISSCRPRSTMPTEPIPRPWDRGDDKCAWQL
jgi:hypothetical protein